ncbi:MAG TPA: amino acid permease [Blastocatellia bacterium]|nr:amino acid permease [Blastocatellia bacterium]
MAQPTEERLVRGIGRWSLVAVAINGIIGAGIFGLPSRVFALIGPSSVIAFIACAVVVTLIIVCFAEVASRFRDTGGPYLYARAAFGPAVGFEVGWLMWLARLTAFAANCNLLIDYLGYFWPTATTQYWREAIIVAVVVLLAAVNTIGVRDAALVSNLFTVGKLIPIILFIAVGLFFISPQNFSSAASPTYSAFSTSVLMLIYAFTGFEMAVIPAGEIRNPQRNLPLAILTAIGLVALLYILIQIVCIGTLPELANSTRPLADASSRFWGDAGGAIISAGVIVSIIGNLNVLVLAGSRLPFAMAEGGGLPRVVSATHRRFRTPYVAILITAAVMLALTLPSNFYKQVNLSVIARLLSYGLTCAALIVLRRKSDVPAPLFKAPAGVAVAVTALVLSAWLLSNSTRADARDSAIAAVAGLLIYAVYKIVKRLTAQTQKEADKGELSETSD